MDQGAQYPACAREWLNIGYFAAVLTDFSEARSLTTRGVMKKINSVRSDDS
jgi:hypothetical protein